MTKDQIEVELGEMDPKAVKLHELLTATELLINSLPSRTEKIELRPTHQEFSEKLTEVVTTAIKNKHPRLAEVGPKIEEVRAQAADAWARKDPVAWRRVNAQVVALASVLRPEIDPMDYALGMAAWLVQDQIPQMRTAAEGKHESEISGIEEQTVKLFHLAQSGLMAPEQAVNSLREMYDAKVRPLCRTLGIIADEKPVISAPGRTGDGGLRVAKMMGGGK